MNGNDTDSNLYPPKSMCIFIAKQRLRRKPPSNFHGRIFFCVARFFRKFFFAKNVLPERFYFSIWMAYCTLLTRSLAISLTKDACWRCTVCCRAQTQR